ncbi:hypothetical protein BYT27DRAFT_7124490 [Phlegmacium glaucopus]|nr:hypothetical protein BYT27DRAFT_7124490 [Phlegmacium glaucopus]
MHRVSRGRPQSNSSAHSQDSLHIAEQNTDDVPSSPCSDSSVDDDEMNCRIKPFWPKYQATFKQRGFQLETFKDVKLFYNQMSQNAPSNCLDSQKNFHQDIQDDDSLCPDAGLPDNLFRGKRISDAKRVMVKAVHPGSREFDVICTLSRPPLRGDPMNHTIPVLDLFEISKDSIAFIVMEEWSSQLITSTRPCCLKSFLAALRQCIEHAAFMHNHHIAHLDISLTNLLTDYKGHYAYIDYELSRRFKSTALTHLICNYRGTEMPPESGKDTPVDPYKVDVWALAVLVLRSCKLTGYWVPQLMSIIKPMLDEDPSQRPTSFAVLQDFDKLVVALGETETNGSCYN